MELNRLLISVSLAFSFIAMSAFSAPATGQTKDALVVCVGGAGDQTINGNVIRLRSWLRDGYSKHGVQFKYYTHDKPREIARAINDHGIKHPTKPIVVIAHSWGGNTVINDAVNYVSVPISLIMTLDPVSKRAHGDGNGTSRKPPKTNRWVNVYSTRKKTSGDFTAIAGGRWHSETEADLNVKTTSKSHEETIELFLKAKAEFVKAISSTINQKANAEAGVVYVNNRGVETFQITAYVQFGNALEGKFHSHLTNTVLLKPSERLAIAKATENDRGSIAANSARRNILQVWSHVRVVSTNDKVGKWKRPSKSLRTFSISRKNVFEAYDGNSPSHTVMIADDQMALQIFTGYKNLRNLQHKRLEHSNTGFTFSSPFEKASLIGVQATIAPIIVGNESLNRKGNIVFHPNKFFNKLNEKKDGGTSFAMGNSLGTTTKLN